MKYLLIFILFCSFTGPGDPPEVGISFNSFWRAKSVAIAGYTKINARYEWVAGAFDSGLHVPQYNGVPSGTRSGVWNADGAVAVDTSNHRLYFYSGGSWRYSTSGTGGSYTFANGLIESAGTVKLGGTLVNNTIVDGDAFDYEIDNFRYGEMQSNGGFTGQGHGIFISDSTWVGSGDVSRSRIVIEDTDITARPFLGRLIIDSLNYTLSTTGKKIMLRDTATGLVQNIDPALLGGSTAISALTAATGTNSIDNGTFEQSWNWDALADNTGLSLTTTSTAAAANAHNLFSVSMAGVNSNSSQTTTSVSVANAHSGTSSTNVGINVSATDAVNNYALIVPSSGGSVGIGTSTPAKIFHTVGTVRHASLGTASGDTTTYKPLGISSAGDVFPMTYWPGGGAGGGVTTMGAIGSSPNANGATISGSTLNLEPASASFGGVVTTGTQTIAGNKTFTGVSVFGSPTVPVGNFQVGGTIWVSGSPGATYYAVHDGTNQATLAPTAMTFTGIGAGFIGYTSGVMNIQGNATYSTVFNDNSADVDFRLEGDGDANLIFADAGNDKVGIGTASPTTKLHVAGRFAATQGADVASAAGAITLGTDGNTFEITGTAAITLISNAGWVNGSEINLVFTSTATLTDGTANSGTDIGMELEGNANFTGSADDIVTLVLCELGGTQRWRMKSKSIN